MSVDFYWKLWSWFLYEILRSVHQLFYFTIASCLKNCPYSTACLQQIQCQYSGINWCSPHYCLEVEAHMLLIILQIKLHTFYRFHFTKTARYTLGWNSTQNGLQLQFKKWERLIWESSYLSSSTSKTLANKLNLSFLVWHVTLENLFSKMNVDNWKVAKLDKENIWKLLEKYSILKQCIHLEAILIDMVIRSCCRCHLF